MRLYQYIIIGGGMTAAAALDGIREIDSMGTVAMFSVESEKPYKRPPLTKGLWKNTPLDSIFLQSEAESADYFMGERVSAIDPTERKITTESGEAFGYEKLLLATGGQLRKLPFGKNNILYYRTLADYQKLREEADQHERFAVIGSGFIGSEIAAALRMNGKEVTLIDGVAGIGAKLFPRDMVDFLNNYFQKKGVRLAMGANVKDVVKEDDSVHIQLENEKSFNVDGVVAGVGIKPDTTLAEAAGLKVEDGIYVDEFLRTSAPYIFAAGDNANFFNPLLGARIRVEHADNANQMGKKAGRNMAGAHEKYDYLPFFYSDLFDLGYEAVGLLDNRFEIVADWQKPYEKGVLYYLDEGRVRGVLLWNVWDKVEQAREVIASVEPANTDQLRGKIV